MKQLSLYLLLLIACTLKSQLPDTELWLFNIENKKGTWSFTRARNITNRAGYDNQPSFSKDAKKIFYVSTREDQQADIYFFDLKHKKTCSSPKPQ